MVVKLKQTGQLWVLYQVYPQPNILCRHEITQCKATEVTAIGNRLGFIVLV